jgi:predicted RNA-binding Zn-ribbon protein involved in translation (DUF1610 family)
VSEQSEPYVCRNCNWAGNKPKIHTWNEPNTPSQDAYGRYTEIRGSSGSMNKCPECDKHVMTQSEWESDDFWVKWTPRIVLGVMGLLAIILALNSFLS